MKVSTDDGARLAREGLEGVALEELRIGRTWWALRFSNDVWLTAQELASSVDGDVSLALTRESPLLLEGVDSSSVPTAAVVVSRMHRTVERVVLTAQAELSLYFEGDVSVTARTDVAVVDWQWSLGSSPMNPYAAPFALACLWRGELEVPGREAE